MTADEAYNRTALRRLINRRQLEVFLACFLATPRVRSYRSLGGGAVKLIYCVHTDQGDFVLHVLPPTLIALFERTPTDFAYEFAFADALAAGGVPIPRRYGTHTGAGYVPIVLDEVPCYLALRAFVPGSSPTHLNRAQQRAAAHVLATMHRIGKQLNLTPPRMQGYTVGDRIATQETSTRILSPELNQVPALPAYVQAFAEIFNAAWSFIVTHQDQLPLFPIHSDYYPGNLVYRRAHLAAIVDLDECHDDRLYVDLGIALESICMSGPPTRIYERAIHFLNDYAAVNPFSPIELNLSVYFWLYRLAGRAHRQLYDCMSQPVLWSNLLADAETTMQTIERIQQLLRAGV